MWDHELFEKALDIKRPWRIANVAFDVAKGNLDIHVDFVKGATFEYEDPQTKETEYCKVYDTVSKTWRHLNFFQHICHIHVKVPRIQPKSGGTKMIFPPWTGKIYGFTLLFEALILKMGAGMPVHNVAKILKITDHKVWAVLDGYAAQGLLNADYTGVNTVGMDETSLKKSHNYVTFFVDLDLKRTLFVTQGKDHQTVSRFANVLKDGGGDPLEISNVSCDMSPAFIKGIKRALPDAQITFDKFHVLKIINEAVDRVRKSEVKDHPVLKGSRFALLKNENNLTSKQRDLRQRLSTLKLKSIKALMIRETFQDIYKTNSKEEFETALKKWYFWATHCKIDPIIKAAKTIKNHWDGILNWKISQINNGILEGLNSVIQAAKRKARGYKFEHFSTMIYLLTGKFDLQKLNPHLPTRF